MARLNILVYPDPRLRQKAKPVKRFDAELRRLAEDMAETMYAAPGIGLAAVQVNVPLRVLVLDLSEEKNDLKIFVNPEIEDRDGTEEIEEGCLSVPGVFASVPRADWVKVRAQDLSGKPFELEAEGLLAVCIQHEIDHLDGKVFVDYLSRLKQDRIRKKLQKEARQRQPEPAAA